MSVDAAGTSACVTTTPKKGVPVRSVFILLIGLGAGARAQMHDMHNMQNMQGMNHNFAGMYLMQQASGTSMNPQSWAMPMIMKQARGWQFMFMGSAFLVETQQSGTARRRQVLFRELVHGIRQHSVGRGSLMLETMLSAEPVTVTDRRYPLLFQTGETAFGSPIVDGQHPHNFVMGLGVHYARPVGSTIVASLLRAGRRSGDRAGGIPASRVGFRTAAGRPGTPLAGLHAHRHERDHRGDQVSEVSAGGERVPRHRAGRESLDHQLGGRQFVLRPLPVNAHAELDVPGFGGPTWSGRSGSIPAT